MREKINQRELLGLGIDIPGMASKGTLERDDDEPTSVNNMANSNGARLRSTLAIRSEQQEGDDMSEGSELMNESVVSSITDRYGFMSTATGDDSTVDNVNNASEEQSSFVEIQRRREGKWLDMLNQWDVYMIKHYKKVRARCRKGIPSSVRARAWMHLCGAQYHMMNPENRTEFRRLHNQRGNQKWIDDIEKDLHRNFPTHEMFGGAYERIGQTELYRVLKAYSVLNPVDGYCQAMAPLAALLLMNMPSEQAFWCLVAICDKYIPGYYSPGMEAIQLDGDILFGLLKTVSPAIHKHMLKQSIEPILYMTEWFLCVFARTLPWPTVMRVWDMFMCEGVKVLFRVALVLIKFSLPKSVRKRCPSMYETLDALKNLSSKITQEDFLIEQVQKLNISEEDMEKEHRKQLKKRRANAVSRANNGIEDVEAQS